MHLGTRSPNKFTANKKRYTVHPVFFVGGGGRLYAKIDCVQSMQIKFMTSHDYMPIINFDAPEFFVRASYYQ